MSEIVTQSLIEDIFAIPRNGSNIQDDDEDVVLDKSEANIAFETKAKELSKELAIAATKEVVEPITKKEVMAENTKPSSGMFGDLFDDDPVKPEPSKEEPVKAQVLPEPEISAGEAAKVVMEKLNQQIEKQVEKLSEKKEEVQVKKDAPELPIPEAKTTSVIDFDSAPEPKEKVTKKKVIPKENEKKEVDIDDDNLTSEWSSDDVWKLKSPAPKYNRFYSEKSIALNAGSRSILPGGKIDFGKYFDDLAGLNCDITVQTNDLEAIHQKMQMVQGLRERCKQIQLHTTQQYYLWERYIELFHGVLCRVDYERGKQEGLNYEHMSDMEHYFCSLKALHRAADQVMRTLDGAFECLSRQVTIALPMKDIERYGSHSSPAPRQITPEQKKKYDALGPPIPTQSTPTKPSNMGWDM